MSLERGSELFLQIPKQLVHLSSRVVWTEVNCFCLVEQSSHDQAFEFLPQSYGLGQAIDTIAIGSEKVLGYLT